MAKSWSLLLSSLYLPLVSSYSFSFQSAPTQCGNVAIAITGTGGTPPYRLSIIPSGSTPIQSGIEVRKVLDMAFNDSSSISFKLPYPTNSGFVAVVSDQNGTGFGTGGATVPVNVGSSGDSSCLPTQQVAPDFTFGLNPDTLTTCLPTLISWASASIQGDIKIWSVIGGGDSFIIPSTPLTTDPLSNNNPAVSYTPQLLSGVNAWIIVGDNRGFGSGGSAQLIVQPGGGNRDCISGSSPSSTLGSPAGGSYPTSTSGASTGGGGSKTNIGAIVGGVVGGIVAIAIIGIIIFVLRRRRRGKQRFDEQPVDLLEGREQAPDDGGQVPEQYLPEPYHIPQSNKPEMAQNSQAGQSGLAPAPVPLSERDRRFSGLTSTSGTGTRLSSDGMQPMSGTSTSAKSEAPPTLRPVNIVQHEDAGPSENTVDEAETVELPPAYTNIKK